MTNKPTHDELTKLFTEETGFDVDDFPAAILDFAHAVLAKWGTPATVGVEPVARLEIGKTKGGVSLTHIAEPAAFQLQEGMYALYIAPQQAGVSLSDDLRDRLVAISEAVADQDDRAAQAMLREILKAPHADSQPAPDERDDFEKVFPLPSGCIRVGTGYASTGYSNWAAHTHCERWQGWQARAARSPADSVGRDAAFEAVRKRLCALPRYSFMLVGGGSIRRVQDRTGNWIEFDDAHELFDPVAIDAALAAQGDTP